MEVKRGDVFIVDFDPAQGSEQAGTRPAVVVQNAVGNRYSPTTIVIVVTAAAQKNYPFLVPLKAVPSTNPALGKIWSPFLLGRETSRNLLIRSTKPDCFVTGDKDFHTGGIKKRIKVLTPAEFLLEFGD